MGFSFSRRLVVCGRLGSPLSGVRSCFSRMPVKWVLLRLRCIFRAWWCVSALGFSFSRRQVVRGRPGLRFFRRPFVFLADAREFSAAWNARTPVQWTPVVLVNQAAVFFSGVRFRARLRVCCRRSGVAGGFRRWILRGVLECFCQCDVCRQAKFHSGGMGAFSGAWPGSSARESVW